jgi:hypothetical protein
MNTKAISDFTKYVDKEILPATQELEKLEDKHRKHLQKLVYTNLVNRFDAMIDNAILDNYKEGGLLEKAIKPMSDNITEGQMLKLLMKADTIHEVIEERLRNSLSNSILRERHSKKLSAILDILSEDKAVWTHPRVNISTGAIVEKCKVNNKSIPHSICGYADWIYSRRNALVHGAGSLKILKNDVDQIKSLFKVDVKTHIRLKVGSITNAASFYKHVAEMML